MKEVIKLSELHLTKQTPRATTSQSYIHDLCHLPWGAVTHSQDSVETHVIVTDSRVESGLLLCASLRVPNVFRFREILNFYGVAALHMDDLCSPSVCNISIKVC